MKMYDTNSIKTRFVNFLKSFTYSYDELDEEQIARLAVEIILILGIIWIIQKKKNPEPQINLEATEEEALISQYKPESLVPEVLSTHPALNPRVVEGKAGIIVNINGFEGINFASHDYLGLIGNRNIEEKAKRCIDTYGVGSCGPRGFYGTSVLHLELEEKLAQFLGTEDSVLFSYGFVTISSSIAAYAKKNDIVFVDEKCNYAIQQGLRASKSEIKYFKHNDVQDLERNLEETRIIDLSNTKKARKSRRHLIVEGIYINTGEICNLPGIIELCKKYKLRIFVDESISFGVLGDTGRGITEHFGIPRKDVDLMMGSFEFSFASIGGFCAGSRFLVDHLLAAALGYMFSASLPPLLVQASIDALDEIKNHPENLQKLKSLSNFMHDKLTASTILNEHFTVSGSRNSPVHVLTLTTHLDSGDVLMDIVDVCFKHHIVLTRAAFLPDKDVALTSPSLRITTTTNHTQELISYLIYVLEHACDCVFS